MFDRRFFLKAGGLAALGLLPWGSGVWNTPLHSTYETELARWWNEEGYRELRGNPCAKILPLFQQMGGLAGLWFMNVAAGSVADESGNGRSLAEDGAVGYTGLDCQNAVNVSNVAGLVRAASAGLEPETAVTMGGWFRVDGTRGDTLIGIKEIFVVEAAYSRFSVSAFGDGGDHSVFASGAIVSGQWCFVVARHEMSTQPGFNPRPLDLFVNGVKAGEDVELGAAFKVNVDNHPFRIGGDFETWGVTYTGAAAFCFVAHSAVSDQLLNLIYSSSRGFFGV